jgi:hypothetical protein
MIELKEDQIAALDAEPQPAVVVDPRTGQQYVLLKRDAYEWMRRWLKPFGRGWDDPEDDDLIRKDV